jgi:hypothetical protein
MMTRPAHQKRKLLRQIALLGVIAAVHASFGAEKPVIEKPRPERPNKEAIKDIIDDFKKQREKFLIERKEARDGSKQEAKDAARAAAKEERDKAREELRSNHAVRPTVRAEAKDSISAAKEQAREQARKLAEEAKEHGHGHQRD